MVFQRAMPMADALQLIDELEGDSVEAHDYLGQLFPERTREFEEFGFTDIAFETSSHLRFQMAEPWIHGKFTDRLDGFHDYCLYCRGENVPGRFDENIGRIHTTDAPSNGGQKGLGAAELCITQLDPVCAPCAGVLSTELADHIGPLLWLQTAPAVLANMQGMQLE